MKRFLDARAMLIVSMAVFGTLGPFVRNITVSSGELALYRAMMAAALIGMFLMVTKQAIPFGKIKKELPLLRGGSLNHALSISRYLASSFSLPQTMWPSSISTHLGWSTE